MSATTSRLREDVCRANLELADSGLVIGTFGNVSGVDRELGLMAIKPSGVPYAELTAECMVLVSLESGGVVEGDLRPSSDTPTHLEMYRSLSGVRGIAHSHSPRAVAFAQARRPVPCLGTTHADHFHGPVPVTRPLTADEVAAAYERATGRVIVERFADLDPVAIPGVLVAGHGPFTWGPDADRAVDNAIALEAIAGMALATLALDPDAPDLERWVRDKHHDRKHGESAYYGQPGSRDD